jgi:uncharacterized protein
MNYKLSQINIYPIKSFGGISLQMADVTDRGLQYDRRWMVVDAEGKFITQRTHQQMALIGVALGNGNVTLSHKLNVCSPISFSVSNYDTRHISVVVWDDTVDACLVDREVDKWISLVMDTECRLVFMPDEIKRVVDQKYSHNNEIVSFADAYPFLIIGEESLNDLNSRLKEKVPMNRFRPNLVFSGGNPFDEDKWKIFRINDLVFHVVKPCSRCVVTTINQDTAEKNDEPLRMLSTYRIQNNKVMFGQNLLHEGVGTIKVGNELEVLEWK